MNKLQEAALHQFRQKTYRTKPEQRVSNQEQAVEFVNQRGFVFFWPITGITLPSLWTAVAGDRAVASAHDDPGHVTWGWKDELLGKGVWYYGKILRKKATMIALDQLPYFYALSENYGSPEEDYLTLYEQGKLTQEARRVYESVLENGPLDTVSLRQSTQLTSRASDSRFDRAIRDLQADFKILPVGISQAGGWRYAFIYDIVTRCFPELPDAAHHIREKDARDRLAEVYFRSVGAAQLRDIKMLFGWDTKSAKQCLSRLLENRIVVRNLEMKNSTGEWFLLNDPTLIQAA